MTAPDAGTRRQVEEAGRGRLWTYGWIPYWMPDSATLNRIEQRLVRIQRDAGEARPQRRNHALLARLSGCGPLAAHRLLQNQPVSQAEALKVLDWLDPPDEGSER